MQCPVILGVEGEARDVLLEAGGGIAITPESAQELADAVLRLANDPELGRRFGEQGRAHVLAQFDRAALAARYLGLLAAVAARRPLPAEAAAGSPAR